MELKTVILAALEARKEALLAECDEITAHAGEVDLAMKRKAPAAVKPRKKRRSKSEMLAAANASALVGGAA